MCVGEHCLYWPQMRLVLSQSMVEMAFKSKRYGDENSSAFRVKLFR